MCVFFNLFQLNFFNNNNNTDNNMNVLSCVIEWNGMEFFFN